MRESTTRGRDLWESPECSYCIVQAGLEQLPSGDLPALASLEAVTLGPDLACLLFKNSIVCTVSAVFFIPCFLWSNLFILLSFQWGSADLMLLVCSSLFHCASVHCLNIGF